ncbi:DUF3592 domain-containing protein [Croceicoccus gelatinilyticus]|uniref:DUF3592 domain-containing protein n=1 Tax=Croceicoccus gelatinilyticus TaxID=2835536 RepID=UPI001BCE3114|nr:DUF3592 domain-containing protein [Croceicoccus gelatinilyticus]MBS7670433.1 hypothetical protein [Croceicoccus gelatinilyticus]
MSSLSFLGFLAAVPLAWMIVSAVAEHDRRSGLLRDGVVVMATVVESESWGRSCRFGYRFEHEGEQFEGGEGGCPLVQDHPVGSRVEVHFAPADASQSIAVGADLWPGWVVVPLLIGPLLLLLGGMLAYAMLKDSRKRARRSALRFTR